MTDMYCPECLEILKKNIKSRLDEVKNPGGLYHYSGSMNRHRKNAHGVNAVQKKAKGGKKN
jgi:histidinol dehydrogenase